MPDDYMARLREARDLIQLAGETAEGRAVARTWLRQVAGEVGPDDEDEVVLVGDQDEVSATEGEPAVQPVPADLADLAAQGYTFSPQALARSGYDLVALSETGDGPVIMLGGQYDNSGGGATMQYDAAAMYQAAVQDEVDRYSLMMQGRRPGPDRPQYAGLALSEPWPLEDEPDADDVSAAIMQLAGHLEGRATYGEVADAVDEVALSRTPETANTAPGRADALVRVAGMFPGSSGSRAAGALDLELARQREVERLTRRDLRQGLDPRVAEIVERNSGLLRDEDEDEDEDEDRLVRGQPAKGGVMHPEVERLAREHGLYLGPPAGNARYEVPSAAERERQERRARAGHQSGLFSIQDLHRGALRSSQALHRKAQRSATSSRG